jgi:hypothetical protein
MDSYTEGLLWEKLAHLTAVVIVVPKAHAAVRAACGQERPPYADVHTSDCCTVADMRREPRSETESLEISDAKNKLERFYKVQPTLTCMTASCSGQNTWFVRGQERSPPTDFHGSDCYKV